MTNTQVCSNCPFLIKELDRLRRIISVLNKQLTDLRNLSGTEIGIQNNIHQKCTNVYNDNSMVKSVDSSCQTIEYNIAVCVDSDCQTIEQFNCWIDTETSTNLTNIITDSQCDIFDNNPSTTVDSNPSTTIDENDCLSCPIDCIPHLNISQEGLNTFSYDHDNQVIVEPLSLLSGTPCSNFDLNELDKSTEFLKVFNNRLVAHYGTHSYTYSGKTHSANPLSSNPYLNLITNHVKSVFPTFDFNSVLVTKYTDGSKYLPYHSDSETDIAENSQIITISLGQSRVPLGAIWRHLAPFLRQLVPRVATCCHLAPISANWCY